METESLPFPDYSQEKSTSALAIVKLIQAQKSMLSIIIPKVLSDIRTETPLTEMGKTMS